VLCCPSTNEKGALFSCVSTPKGLSLINKGRSNSVSRLFSEKKRKKLYIFFIYIKYSHEKKNILDELFMEKRIFCCCNYYKFSAILLASNT
jgi:hypothetical protein